MSQTGQYWDTCHCASHSTQSRAWNGIKSLAFSKTILELNNSDDSVLHESKLYILRCVPSYPCGLSNKLFMLERLFHVFGFGNILLVRRTFPHQSSHNFQLPLLVYLVYSFLDLMKSSLLVGAFSIFGLSTRLVSLCCFATAFRSTRKSQIKDVLIAMTSTYRMRWQRCWSTTERKNKDVYIRNPIYIVAIVAIIAKRTKDLCCKLLLAWSMNENCVSTRI